MIDTAPALRKALEEAKAELTELKQHGLGLAKQLDSFFTKGAPPIEAADFIAGKAATAASNIAIALSADRLIVESREATERELAEPPARLIEDHQASRRVGMVATAEGIKIRDNRHVAVAPNGDGPRPLELRIEELAYRLAGFEAGEKDTRAKVAEVATRLGHVEGALAGLSRRVGDIERREAQREQMPAGIR